MPSLLDRFVESYNTYETATAKCRGMLDTSASLYARQTHLNIKALNPGSAQLVYALAAKDKQSEQAAEAIRQLEAICHGEPMIGMELYPQGDEGLLSTAIFDFLCPGYNYRVKPSGRDGVKTNLRPLPTYHPLFAALMAELSLCIPQHDVTPYMLCLGRDMERYSVALLSAWLFSYPEIVETANTMGETTGDFSFPGIYFGQRVERPFISWSKREWKEGIGSQTNLYAGLMHPVLPDAKEFMRMAGILSKVQKRDLRSRFRAFVNAFGKSLKDVGLNPENYLRLQKDVYLRVRSNNQSVPLPYVAEAAIGLGPDRSHHIRTSVQSSVAEIEQGLYTSEELELINRAYAGEL